eukprot:TRINITY_DN8760_c0_g1_i1.p1 TRINITY_DN8760_c0_g1~~TRINITY_DN8760_c0_g1_i1.p1  ORF type:complete len:635 (+),score=67.02 TRINITY_DN8760_c0_g1_i1:59-1963(+)
MQEESTDPPPAHVAVGRVDGKAELATEQVFKIISQQQGRRTEVRRTDAELEWLSASLGAEFKSVAHPRYPKTTGWLRHRTTLNKISQELRNEILCRYVGCILQYYLKHEKIAEKSGELYSVLTAREDELAHLMTTETVMKRAEKKKSWFSKIFDFSNTTSGTAGCRDKPAIVFYKGVVLTKKNLDMAVDISRKENSGYARDQAYLEAIFSTVENFSRVCESFTQLSKATAGIGRALPSSMMDWFLCKRPNNSIASVLETPKSSVFDRRMQSLMNMKQKTQLHNSSPLTARGSSCSSLSSLVTPRVRASPMTPRVGSSVGNLQRATGNTSTPSSTAVFSGCSELKDYSSAYDWTPLPPQQEEISEPGFSHVLASCGRYLESVQPTVTTTWRASVGPICANVLLHANLSTTLGSVLDEVKVAVDSIVKTRINPCLSEMSHLMQTRPGDCFSRINVKGIEENVSKAETEGNNVITACKEEHLKVRNGVVFGMAQMASVFIKGQIESAEREIEAFESVLNLLEADSVNPFDISDIELPVRASEEVCYTSTRTPSVASLTTSEEDVDEPSPVVTPREEHPAALISPNFSSPRPASVPKLQMGHQKKPTVQQTTTSVPSPTENPLPKKKKILVADAFDDL